MEHRIKEHSKYNWVTHSPKKEEINKNPQKRRQLKSKVVCTPEKIRTLLIDRKKDRNLKSSKKIKVLNDR